METKVGKEFWRTLGVNPGNVRLANDDKLKTVLQVQKGQVSPFALVNDKDRNVKELLLDQNLVNHSTWAFHPMDNTKTWEITQEVFRNAFVKGMLARECSNIDLTQQESKQENKEEKKDNIKEKKDNNKDKKDNNKKQKKEIDDNDTKL